MKKPTVNIIIVTTNQFKFVGDCIKTVLNSGYPNIKIFLVDNNSNKTEYDRFYNNYKNIKELNFSRLAKNAGFAHACNHAIKRIKKGYIVFLNDDTMVTKHWLEPVIEYMEKNPEVGACQPKIKDMKRKEFFEYAGAGGGFMDVYGYPFCRGRIFYTVEKDRGQYDDTVNVVWTSGNCMITRVDVIKKVGLMDEIFFIYGEEADLCWRMHYYGYRLAYIPSSVVYHYGSGTMGRESPRKVFLHHRNGLILLLKNYTIFELIKYLPVRIFLDIISFWYYLIDNKLPMNSLAVLRAYISLFYLMPAIIEKRKTAAFRNCQLNNNYYPLYKKSVILNYFLYKKKKYNQL